MRPNLLFVFADQLRGMDLGCMGNADVKTPRLDRLAAEGRTFTQAIANTPVCGPNRASMLTGLTPLHARVPVNDFALPDGLPTVGTIARANGYRTGYIGKWHLDGLPRDKFTPPGPRRFGFEEWAAFNCFHDYFTARYFQDSPEMIRSEVYEPCLQTDLAIDFMKRDATKPFALMVSWGPPHDPYHQVPEAYRRSYRPDDVALRPNVQEETGNPLAAGLNCRQTYADYYAAITALDAEIGRLIDAIDGLGLKEKTLVIFSSDHGDMLWSHGWMKKQLPYQESIRVPLLARQPGSITAGTFSDCLIGSTDLLPTLCTLMDWKHEAVFDGEDLSAAFFSAHQRSGPLLLANYVTTDESEKQSVPEWRGLYTGTLTYVERAQGVPWLLFENERDPFQLSNLVGQPAAASLQDAAQKELAGQLRQLGDPFLPGKELLQGLGLWEEFIHPSSPRYTPEMQEELRLSRQRRPKATAP